jgi:hypothetical protein
MQAGQGHNNVQSLFGTHQIPCDNQIRNLLDEVPPVQLFPLFEELFERLEQTGQLSKFRAFDNNLLMAIDGTEYFSSTTLHCPNCSSRQHKNGTIHHFHGVVTPVLVCPGQTQVIPLVPEFIQPQDGHDKQDSRGDKELKSLLYIV